IKIIFKEEIPIYIRDIKRLLLTIVDKEGNYLDTNGNYGRYNIKEMHFYNNPPEFLLSYFEVYYEMGQACIHIRAPSWDSNEKGIIAKDFIFPYHNILNIMIEKRDS
ncbi:MAG: hypothetical protein ACFFG0_12170, partial [Candidatus Thorarchaeota archaeon]